MPTPHRQPGPPGRRSPQPATAVAAAAPVRADGARAGRSGAGRSFRLGVIQSLPFLLVIIPFALLFGLAASEAGMDLAQTMGFSVLVLAGASQFTAVQLLSDQVPTALVILSALAVNLRMAMYSASLVPWLGAAPMGHRAALSYLMIDQSYAMSIQRYEAEPKLTMAERLGYFYGAAATLCLPWMLASWVGATAGRAIPDSIPLDFAMPITFLAMIAPMLRTTAHLVACAVAIIAALVLAGLPNGTGLLIAAPLGMAAGAWVETMTEKRRAR